MVMDKQLLDKTLYTTREVARLAKVTQNYIRKLCISGDIKAEKVGRDWIIKTNEVIRFLSRNE